METEDSGVWTPETLDTRDLLRTCGEWNSWKLEMLGWASWGGELRCTFSIDIIDGHALASFTNTSLQLKLVT